MNVQVKANRTIVDGTTEVRMNAVFNVAEVFPKWTAQDILKNNAKGLISVDNRDIDKVKAQYEKDQKKVK